MKLSLPKTEDCSLSPTSFRGGENVGQFIEIGDIAWVQLLGAARNLEAEIIGGHLRPGFPKP
jgi:hypothetical protein